MTKLYLSPLKILLLEMEISQKDFARLLKIPEQSVSALVLGYRKPSLKLAEKLTQFFISHGYQEINELYFLYPERYAQKIDVKKIHSFNKEN